MRLLESITLIYCFIIIVLFDANVHMLTIILSN